MADSERANEIYNELWEGTNRIRPADAKSRRRNSVDLRDPIRVISEELARREEAESTSEKQGS